MKPFISLRLFGSDLWPGVDPSGESLPEAPEKPLDKAMRVDVFTTKGAPRMCVNHPTTA